MHTTTLKTALFRISEENPHATLLVDGNSLAGFFQLFNLPKSVKFIYHCDYMAFGTASPNILSPEFIALRIEALNNPFSKHRYTEEDYELYCATPLRELSAQVHSDIYLLCYDCYLSQIWQLTMLAYLEQLGLCDSVKLLVFYEDDNNGFLAKKVERLPTVGAHDAYCKLVCKHEYTELSDYLISPEAVNCYLDVNRASGGYLREYILEICNDVKSVYTAYCIFLKDHQNWGLGDGEFIKIALQTLYNTPGKEYIAEKWKKGLVY